MGAAFTFMIFAIVPLGAGRQRPGRRVVRFQLDWYFPELGSRLHPHGRRHRSRRRAQREEPHRRDRRGRRRLHRRRLDHRPGPRRDRHHEQLRDHRHRPATRWRTRCPGTSSAAFGAVMFVVNIPLAFLVPSSSGTRSSRCRCSRRSATSRASAAPSCVTAYQSASGWMNLFTPTSAVVMGGLALAKVGYGAYLRFLAAAARHPARPHHRVPGSRRRPELSRGAAPVRPGRPPSRDTSGYRPLALGHRRGREAVPPPRPQELEPGLRPGLTRRRTCDPPSARQPPQRR